MQQDDEYIRTQFSALRQQGQRHRDIAEGLGISEGALIAAHTSAAHSGSLRATPLAPAWRDILAALPGLGEVMALTRNAACVHEAVGVYGQGGADAEDFSVEGANFTLCINDKEWAQGFAVRENGSKGMQQSLQFFDAGGTAVHKVFLQANSHEQAYAALLKQFDGVLQPAARAAFSSPTKQPIVEKPDAQIDVAGLREGWMRLRGAQGFEPMLSRFGVTRLQALRLADPQFAQSVDASCVHAVLDVAARDALPLAIRVQNVGAAQTRTGRVHRIAVMGPWLNVLDPGFNLHLREDLIASAWLVKKPSVNGLCLSLELFDTEGNLIAALAGVRQPGKAEPCDWCALMDTLTEESLPCAS
ncbi:hemin-degrading factor [Ottowia testudinis]|uniref:Hemin-degrading factor n=1 Tax=Ottowia testudinis TaxID=2816950 RepID=A0A975CGA5_9BURK|nr:hemin-degrading factor [Ottowia testudinis]